MKKLFGHEPLTKYIVLMTVAIQVFTAYTVRDWNWGPFLAAVYIVGATANHSLFLAIHEMSHNLGAKSLIGNHAIAMLANLPITIAYSVTFRPYHMAHHRNQGLWGTDTDIPTELEAMLVTRTATNYVDHTIRKTIFMFFQIFGYALRPMIMKVARHNDKNVLCKVDCVEEIVYCVRHATHPCSTGYWRPPTYIAYHLITTTILTTARHGAH
jgi:sphingolipid delta-4 desaturase